MREPANGTSWDRFLQLYTPLLFAFARRLNVYNQDAADLVQEVLTVLVKKMPEFNYSPQLRFRGWLWTVTLNKWRELQRRKRPVLAENGLFQTIVAEDAIEEFSEEEYRIFLVQRAAQLIRSDFKEETWQIFWKCTALEKPAEEVASEMKVSLDAVYAAKSRVLRRLRVELKGLLD